MQSTNDHRSIKPDNRDKISGKFHRPPSRPSGLESADYGQERDSIRETKRSDYQRESRGQVNRVFLAEKMSEVKAVVREAGDMVEAILRLLIPGHEKFRRKMGTNKTFRDNSLVSIIFSSVVMATLLAL